MATTRSGGTAPAQRLLEAAGDLFVREGIRAVGIDRVIAEAGVARASLYHAFGSKDALVAAYLDDQDDADRRKWEKATAGLDTPRDKILALFDLAHGAAVARRFRGCLYLNAATEFPDPGHPARAAVDRHRAWLHALLVDLVEQTGASDVEGVAERVRLLYDGAVAGSKFSRSTAPIELGKELAASLLDGAQGWTASRGRAR
ncbi:TetR/AcrR family transcriptional regulator [Saccharopolyspora gloriosae]|uniref:AcrR family transcriptional regulator n=1 Tax=Saccharopolyspora gloriosae TaxID=455344 RepID=A0A840NHV6_9PSEU|nr:TetR family transcriptional regulator [Saccharopolyspora gloriosae]MBB5068879.1 AcrR family transcriptional regulator [Saccharopolyspora gloriosae]